VRSLETEIMAEKDSGRRRRPSKICKGCVVPLLTVCKDYCREERESLIEGANCTAERLGHALGEYVHVEGFPIWQARCQRCGRLVVINLDPAPGELAISGEAVAVKCSADDGDHTE